MWYKDTSFLDSPDLYHILKHSHDAEINKIFHSFVLADITIDVTYHLPINTPIPQRWPLLTPHHFSSVERTLPSEYQIKYSLANNIVLRLDLSIIESVWSSRVK